eukprot:2749624-Rhodomonas_salina.5
MPWSTLPSPTAATASSAVLTRHPSSGTHSLNTRRYLAPRLQVCLIGVAVPTSCARGALSFKLQSPGRLVSSIGGLRAGDKRGSRVQVLDIA